MNLQIHLPPNLENALKLRATAAGKDIASFVVDALREELAQEEPTTNFTDPAVLSFGDWLTRWRERAPKTNHFVDDSRESIYAGRGE